MIEFPQGSGQYFLIVIFYRMCRAVCKWRSFEVPCVVQILIIVSTMYFSIYFVQFL